MAPKHILMLQGPIGSFFRRLADEFLDHDVAVTKVNFNAGDSVFFRGDNVINYRDPMEEWPEYFRKIVRERNIDTLFLVGDHRAHHKSVMTIAHTLGISVWVFEEGYLRPNHITLEQDGVNGNSKMSKDPEFYRDYATANPDSASVKGLGNTFPAFASQSVLYTCAMAAGGLFFPHYQHYRDTRVIGQTLAWTKSVWRKKFYQHKERDILGKATGEWSGDFFLVPLQLYCDFQIDHSDYESIPSFIEEVVETFAKSAPSDTRLLVKHHPLDRAYRDYTKLLAKLANKHGIEGRLYYIHDQHLPTLLKHARGCVTMNSTVGTSALFEGVPVKVMGRAIYNFPELTYQASLASFFCEICTVDSKLFHAFNNWMCDHNQYNGSFYKQTAGVSPERVICERFCKDEGFSDKSLSDQKAEKNSR